MINISFVRIWLFAAFTWTVFCLIVSVLFYVTNSSQHYLIILPIVATLAILFIGYRLIFSYKKARKNIRSRTKMPIQPKNKSYLNGAFDEVKYQPIKSTIPRRSKTNIIAITLPLPFAIRIPKLPNNKNPSMVPDP